MNPEAEPTNSPATVKPQEVIPPGLDTVLRKAGIDPTPDVTKAIEISLMMFRGSLPLPPPPILAEYEKTFPGLTEKIIHWTEEQRTHRQSLERQTDRRFGEAHGSRSIHRRRRRHLGPHYGRCRGDMEPDSRRRCRYRCRGWTYCGNLAG
jgi:hypothetical protein